MTVYRNIRRGKWQRVLTGVYRLSLKPLTEEARRIAAALFCGPGAQLTGLMVLHWYGFRQAPSTDKVHVLVPHGVRRKYDWRRTLSRHNLLSQYGIIVLHFTPAEIRREPRRVLRAIERTYQARLVERPIIDVLTGDPPRPKQIGRDPA